MNKDNIVILVMVIVLAYGFYIYVIDDHDSDNTQNTAVESEVSFNPISSSELSGMLAEKDFKLVDVHIPEQKHIPATDAFIPYNEIEKIVEFLPDKNEKIVLYCRSGSMSKTVAKDLIERGYTDIYDLTNGLNEWTSEGGDVVEVF